MIYPAWFIRNRYFVGTSFSRNTINISLLLKYIRSYKRVFYRCRYPPVATKIDRFGLDGSETTGGGVQEKPGLFDELDVATSNKSVGAKKRPTDSNAVMTPSSSRGSRARPRENFRTYICLSRSQSSLCTVVCSWNLQRDRAANICLPKWERRERPRQCFFRSTVSLIYYIMRCIAFFFGTSIFAQ